MPPIIHHRVPLKDSDVFEALGTLDELNCALGICRLHRDLAVCGDEREKEKKEKREKKRERKSTKRRDGGTTHFSVSVCRQFPFFLVPLLSLTLNRSLFFLFFLF
jgi:hypothetical protein